MIRCDHPMRVDVLDAPTDQAMRIANDVIAEWKTTLDWLAER